MTKVTGWDNGLCQDYDKGLGRWFANRLGARQQLRQDFKMTQFITIDRATLEYLVVALEGIEALIEHQYTGTREGMNALQNASDDAQVALNKLRAALANAERVEPSITRIQRECLRIGEEVQRAAGELPDGYELEVYVERGYGCVYLRNPSYDVKEFSDTVDGISHCITQAIDHAKKMSAP